MNSVNTLSGKRDDLQKKIVLTAIALIGLMLLFPPKVIFNKNPLSDATQTQSAGYQFLFSDPSAEQKKEARILLGDEVDKYIGSHIDWGKLLFQLVIVAGGAVVATRFLAPRQSQ